MKGRRCVAAAAVVVCAISSGFELRFGREKERLKRQRQRVCAREKERGEGQTETKDE